MSESAASVLMSDCVLCLRVYVKSKLTALDNMFCIFKWAEIFKMGLMWRGFFFKYEGRTIPNYRGD